MAVVSPPLPGRARTRRIIPGFGLSLGYTLLWLGLIVLIPLVGVFFKASGLGVAGLWSIWTEPRVLAALRISFGTAAAAAAFNAVMGTLVAWVFVRYRFPGKRVFDAMIDLPFALPTAVATLRNFGSDACNASVSALSDVTSPPAGSGGRSAWRGARPAATG